MPEIGGIDFSFTKPDPAATKAAGFSFVVGYLSADPSKNLTREQLAGYIASGLDVGLVWETTAKRATAGAPAGTADGQAAEAQADALGYPGDAVIFFAVDFDAQPADFGAIQAYAAAFDANTTRPVGIYGSYAVVERFVTPGAKPVGYGWQTTAWSGTNLSQKAHLYQRVGHVNWPATIGGCAPSAFDEDVLCLELPLATAAAAPPPQPAPPTPAGDDGPYIPPTGHDLAGDGDGLRGHIGDAGPRVQELQHELNHDFPAYSQLPETGFYGHETAAVLEEFSHRAAAEHDEPAADRAGLAASDGEDLGPRTAAALHRHGLI